jgi:hypothetical protein
MCTVFDAGFGAVVRQSVPHDRAWLRFVVSHPSRKNKDAARMGHPAGFGAVDSCYDPQNWSSWGS